MSGCAARLRRALAAAAVVSLVAGCATGADPRDPFESYNRAMFAFNDGLDRTVVQPVAKGYKAVLPTFVRTGVTNFFSNLGDVWIGVNNFLQGKVDRGLSDSFRVVVNTLFGFGGLIDVASDLNLEKHNEDFGQTLAVWGVGSGPYLVLPIFGPSTVRDTGGFVVDWFGYVPGYVLRDIDPPHRVTVRNTLITLEYVNVRANLLGTTNVLEQAALDRYTFVRDFWLRRRRNLIYDGEPPPEKQPDEEDYQEEPAPPPAPGKPGAAATPQTDIATDAGSRTIITASPRAFLLPEPDHAFQDPRP